MAFVENFPRRCYCQWALPMCNLTKPTQAKKETHQTPGPIVITTKLEVALLDRARSIAPLRLPESLWAAVQHKAIDERTTAAELVAQAIREFLKKGSR